MPSEIGFPARARLELAYFSGYAVIAQRSSGGAGVILRFQRVRPQRSGSFQPLQSQEITPEFLDRTVSALKRWKFDIVSMDEVCQRAVTLASPRRFVSLTFDGAYKDVATAAHPILSRHRVPFTVYVPTAFPDGVGEAWWLALEAIVARKAQRLSLVIDRREMHFDIGSAAEKYRAYDFLESWLRSLSPPELSSAINDLCHRYSVDLAALSREAFMDWGDLSSLTADPRVTIGAATVNYPILANLKAAAALREMTMGAAVANTAFHRDVRHFAFPFGDSASFRRSDIAAAAEAGFTSAVSAIPGVVQEAGRTDLHALPRIAWDGRLRSLRAMRAMLSGVRLPRSTEPAPDTTLQN